MIWGVKKALIISATGSGKTFLAGFDVFNFNARRLLFIVHRDTILQSALNTFEKIFKNQKTYGIYNGKNQEQDCDFIFVSSQMLVRHLNDFDPLEFDYICYDEVHHIVADSGISIFEYFKPDFLLGLTATPERLDNKDIYHLFEQNVPFELRIKEAINNELIVPFHYYGIRDELIDYNRLLSNNKIARNIAQTNNVEFIIKEIKKHQKENEKLKAIAFCTSIIHCQMMANMFNENGYKATSLTGNSNTGERIKAFKELQDEENDLKVICTVDILNEGVDIPSVNMILFLRPTESSTIFLQQLGRGLRKYPNKDYLTVLDFIGNDYDRSGLISMALSSLASTPYTEKAYLKQLISNDFYSIDIPGVLIKIDELSKKEIINYIDKVNFNKKTFFKQDFENFKKYLGNNEIPKHLDYLISPFAPSLDRFTKSKINGKRVKSYYNFLKLINEDNIPLFNEQECLFIENIEEIVPVVRVDEILIVKGILEKNLDFDLLIANNKRITKESVDSAISQLLKKE